MKHEVGYIDLDGQRVDGLQKPCADIKDNGEFFEIKVLQKAIRKDGVMDYFATAYSLPKRYMMGRHIPEGLPTCIKFERGIAA